MEFWEDDYVCLTRKMKIKELRWAKKIGRVPEWDINTFGRFSLACFQLYVQVDFWGRNDFCGSSSGLVERHYVAFSACTSVLGCSLCFLLCVCDLSVRPWIPGIEYRSSFPNLCNTKKKSDSDASIY